MLSFYTADEKLCKYENSLGEKSKNRDKLIQSGTPRLHTKNRGCLDKIETVGIFVLHSFVLGVYLAAGKMSY